MSGAPPLPPASILGSMRADGSHLTVHPADVRGRWLRARRLVFALLVAFYLAAPFVPIGGHPMIQLDVEHRSFYLFGNTFNAQDFWLVLLLTLSFVFALLAITAWRGRVWCGWACPQTVFLEAIYRPIERFIDGPRQRRIRLAAAPWSVAKLARRAAKLALYLAVSIAIAHTAAALFVSPKTLSAMIVEGPAAHREAFLLTLGFTIVLFFNFAWFREQFCVVLCPYGRLQSVLHDRDSITIAYDEARGEPRGKLVKSPPVGAVSSGDCIDCQRCVVVCPTAIDIRSGLQMECLACLQCADACDEVMVKVGRPTGLIRLMSPNQQDGQPRRVWRPRLAVYVALFLVVGGSLGASLMRRSPFEANILRPRGSNPFTLDGDWVRNAVELHLVNKHPRTARFSIRVEAPVAAQIVVGTPEVELASLTGSRVPISISIARRALDRPIEFVVIVDDRASGGSRSTAVRFLAPPARAPSGH